MTLTTWIVRRSRFPFATPGEQLGTVEARSRKAALMLAKQQFAQPFTVEQQSARVNPELERVVDRAVKAATRRERGGYARGGFRRQVMSDRAITNPDDGDSAA